MEVQDDYVLLEWWIVATPTDPLAWVQWEDMVEE